MTLGHPITGGAGRDFIPSSNTSPDGPSCGSNGIASGCSPTLGIRSGQPRPFQQPSCAAVAVQFDGASHEHGASSFPSVRSLRDFSRLLTYAPNPLRRMGICAANVKGIRAFAALGEIKRSREFQTQEPYEL